jgi:ribosome biogenesis GTPase
LTILLSNMDERPVIFLDSGIGGIPYACFFHSGNRAEKLVYAADRANFPYGPKPRETVIELALSLVKGLIEKYDPKVVAIACNAISVSALKTLRDEFPGLPFVGTVPAIKPAVQKSRKRRVGLIGTQRAVEDPYIAELAAKYGPDCEIVKEAAPGLVEFVEQHWLAADSAERLLAVKPWVEKFRLKGADALVLACTHFLLLKEEFSAAAGTELELFDSVEGVSKRVEAILDREGGRLRSPLAREEGVPIMAVTGEKALEPHWVQLAALFGFTLEKTVSHKALVIRCSRNLFTVQTGDKKVECRIKGKILKSAVSYYNPLAPGDIVEIQNGLILGLEKRRNEFARFSQKGQVPQLLASNVDLVLCVASFSSPPFRPRFLDRALLQADAAGIPATIVCNKSDLVRDETSGDPDVEERLSDFERIGCPVFRLSAVTGEGLDEFKRFTAGKFSVLVGQSGVGKSSLVNALIPNLKIKTGVINEKYDRGNHTTTQGILFESRGDAGVTRIIDTPGIRRFAISGIPAEDLVLYMREFAPLAGKCSYGLSCSHKTEPGCKIMEAVYAGAIHEDRYASFLKVQEELAGKAEYPDTD